MRQKLIILLTIYLFFNSALSAQNIEKMNKTELRKHIAFLTTKIDSIKNENIGLQESISKLSKNSSLFEQKNKANEIEIIRLNELILKNENERKRINSENETTIAKLNETISTLKDKYPRVEKVVVKDKLFTGQIDKYPITIYLKYNQISNYHAGVYSVEGWYYYNKVKTKIPLTGLYNYSKLTLYHFNDTTKSNELLNFREMKDNHWEDMEYYENLKDYREKFVLSDNGNFWLNESKNLEVKLNQNDLSILNVNEYLLRDSTTAFDLHNFGGWTWNFELVANKEGKYILRYEHDSRLSFMGMCGGGLEKGFLILEFNPNNSLVYSEEFVYESCNGSIWTEDQNEITEGLTIYNCYGEKEYNLTVDLNELKIEKKEKN